MKIPHDVLYHGSIIAIPTICALLLFRPNDEMKTHELLVRGSSRVFLLYVYNP